MKNIHGIKMPKWIANEYTAKWLKYGKVDSAIDG
jgi:hypothetical protein